MSSPYSLTISADHLTASLIPCSINAAPLMLQAAMRRPSSIGSNPRRVLPLGSSPITLSAHFSAAVPRIHPTCCAVFNGFPPSAVGNAGNCSLGAAVSPTCLTVPPGASTIGCSPGTISICRILGGGPSPTTTGKAWAGRFATSAGLPIAGGLGGGKPACSG